MVWMWIGGGLLLLLVLIVFYYFNKIVLLNNIIENSWSQIDVQLKKRTDLVPNLVETVKGYAKHERGIMKAVTDARKAMMGAKTPQAKMKASNALTEALKSILALAENYPNLKANENFKLLQEQLEGIENKIAYSRQFYNDSVLDYNNVITTVPGMWFAALFGRTQKKPYFEVSEAERKVVKVKF